MRTIVYFALCIFSLGSSVLSQRQGRHRSGMEVLYRWKTMDFEFPDETTKETMIQSGRYIPGNVFPLDIDTYEKDGDERIFLTMPKFFEGNPVTLAYISPTKVGDENLLRPYPDWSWHEPGNCDTLQSVFRVQIDVCGRLWALDTAFIDIFTNRRRECPPQIIAFSLETDKVIGKYKFPESVLKPESTLATLAVDVRDADRKCHDTFVYIADVTGYGLVVFDARRSRSWRIVHPSVYPYPPYGTFKINSLEFDLMDGALGLGLTALTNGDRRLYYHSFASLRESWVQTSILRNESYFTIPGVNLARTHFKTSTESRLSQAAPQAFDSSGNLFFSNVGHNNLMCWNEDKPYTRNNMEEVARDDVNMQFCTGLKIVTNEKNKEEEVWMLTNKFQVAIVNGKMNSTETNYRVLRGRVRKLVQGTKCGHKQIVFPNTPQKPSRHPSTGYGTFQRH